MAIFILACFILFIFGAKDEYNQTERKIYTKKFIENKSLQAADCHCIHSQHEFSHEIIVSILIKTWTPSTPLLTLWCTMLNKWCVVFLIISKHFFKGPGLFLSFNWPLSASFSRKYSLYALYSSMSIVVFSFSSARLSSKARTQESGKKWMVSERELLQLVYSYQNISRNKSCNLAVLSTWTCI